MKLMNRDGRGDADRHLLSIFENEVYLLSVELSAQQIIEITVTALNFSPPLGEKPSGSNNNIQKYSGQIT